MEDAGLKKNEIHEIVLVGGSTRIRKVQELIKEYFDGKEPIKGINPDEAVASGAAVQGSILGGYADVSTKKSQVFTTYQDQQTNVTIQGTGNKENITITKEKGRFSAEDIQTMVQEAEEIVEQDELMKKKVDARSFLETYCYNMKNTFEDKLGGNLEEENKTKIAEAVQEALE
ncbi:hypothetical protein BSKO_02772 [Bryopsis sp. KO-2023]|nr:hypothetical protein BSKO_02772 [Bryopsis sp. KO-2023]